MNKVVFSSPGESQTFKRFTSQGTALPDSPSSRKTQSVQYQGGNKFNNQSQSNLNYAGSIKEGTRSISSTSKVKTNKSQKPPKSEDTQALLQQFEGSPAEYYKAKCKVLSSKVDQQELEIKQLKLDNEKLRNLNFDYVHQINLISHEKLRGLEKIVITSDVFDIENIEQKSVKEFVRKLANNYKIQEREQKKLINHCKVMEADIEVYKTKMKDADTIIDTLKASGATSISELMKQLEELSTNNKNLEQERSELTLNNAILKENIDKQGRLYDDVQQQMNETSDQLQDLKTKHNKVILDKQDDDQSNKKQIYQLKCKCDELEYQLRRNTQQVRSNKNEKIEAQIQNKELQMLNKTLANSAAGFYNAKKYLTTTNGFKFK